MTRTVELVIAGDGAGVFHAAATAVRAGQSVLVLLRSSDTRVGRRLHRRLRHLAIAGGGACAVESDVAVVCVDGIAGVEAVVFRHRRTGRLDAVNATAFTDACTENGKPIRSAVDFD